MPRHRTRSSSSCSSDPCAMKANNHQPRHESKRCTCILSHIIHRASTLNARCTYAVSWCTTMLPCLAAISAGSLAYLRDFADEEDASPAEDPPSPGGAFIYQSLHASPQRSHSLSSSTTRITSSAGHELIDCDSNHSVGTRLFTHADDSLSLRPSSSPTLEALEYFALCRRSLDHARRRADATVRAAVPHLDRFWTGFTSALD